MDSGELTASGQVVVAANNLGGGEHETTAEDESAGDQSSTSDYQNTHTLFNHHLDDISTLSDCQESRSLVFQEDFQQYQQTNNSSIDFPEPPVGFGDLSPPRPPTSSAEEEGDQQQLRSASVNNRSSSSSATVASQLSPPDNQLTFGNVKVKQESVVYDEENGHQPMITASSVEESSNHISNQGKDTEAKDGEQQTITANSGDDLMINGLAAASTSISTNFSAAGSGAMATIAGDYNSHLHQHHNHHLQHSQHSKPQHQEVDTEHMQTTTKGPTSNEGEDVFSSTTTTPPDNNNNNTTSNGDLGSVNTGDHQTDKSISSLLDGNGNGLPFLGYINNSATSSPSPSPTPSSSTTTSANGGSDAANQRQYRKTLEYLKQLFTDREHLRLVPLGIFSHVGRLLESEIGRVRASLIHIDGSADQRRSLVLPEPQGEIISRSTKVFVPAEKYPDLNFIGRIIGPRGLTIRELEVDCGCKLYIRGKGSLRDKNREEKLKGQENWAHLNEDLHVLITVEDAENRAALKLERAVDEINKLLESVISNKDEFKMRQLAELAILNDKFKMQGGQTGSVQPGIVGQPTAVAAAAAAAVAEAQLMQSILATNGSDGSGTTSGSPSSGGGHLQQQQNRQKQMIYAAQQQQHNQQAQAHHHHRQMVQLQQAQQQQQVAMVAAVRQQQANHQALVVGLHQAQANQAYQMAVAAAAAQGHHHPGHHLLGAPHHQLFHGAHLASNSAHQAHLEAMALFNHAHGVPAAPAAAAAAGTPLMHHQLQGADAATAAAAAAAAAAALAPLYQAGSEGGSAYGQQHLNKASPHRYHPYGKKK